MIKSIINLMESEMNFDLISKGFTIIKNLFSFVKPDKLNITLPSNGTPTNNNGDNKMAIGLIIGQFIATYWKELAVAFVTIGLIITIVIMNSVLNSRNDTISTLENDKKVLIEDKAKCIKVNEENSAAISDCKKTNTNCFMDLDACNKNCDDRIKNATENMKRDFTISLKFCNDKLNIALNKKCPACPVCEKDTTKCPVCENNCDELKKQLEDLWKSK